MRNYIYICVCVCFIPTKGLAMRDVYTIVIVDPTSPNAAKHPGPRPFRMSADPSSHNHHGMPEASDDQ